MAHSVSISCPSCGVAIEDTNAHTRSLNCPHCDNRVYFGSNGWESAGLFEHAIDAPSMLQLGKSGELADRHFVVAGRVRMSYEGGYWDEWWLEFDDGVHQWLVEDDGSYRLHETLDVDADAGLMKKASVGGNLSIDGEDWFVTERIDAKVAGVEGSLPMVIFPAEEVVGVAVMGNGSKLSIEVSEQQVLITRSSVVRGAAFKWS